MNLKLAEFVSLVLFGSGGMVLVFSLVSRLLNARAERRALGRRMVCRLCLHAFEHQNGSGSKVIECPACGVLSERRR